MRQFAAVLPVKPMICLHHTFQGIVLACDWEVKNWNISFNYIGGLKRRSRRSVFIFYGTIVNGTVQSVCQNRPNEHFDRYGFDRPGQICTIVTFEWPSTVPHRCSTVDNSLIKFRFIKSMLFTEYWSLICSNVSHLIIHGRNNFHQINIIFESLHHTYKNHIIKLTLSIELFVDHPDHGVRLDF